MKRAEAVKLIVAAHDEPRVVIAGVGATSGALWDSAQSLGNLYNMDFAYPTPVGLGIAIARPDVAVITLEGDGSAFGGMGVYCTIATYRPPNLTTVVFDNGVYGTGSGRFATPTGAGVRLEQVAESCGIPAECVNRVADADNLAEVLAAWRTAPGPRFLVVETDTSDARSGARPQVELDFTECALQFQRYLRALPSPEPEPAGGAR
jgi:thiamine pyrophosphate-dependent acetolactate synthase large subunit-like protein